jgi:putative ABC transport system permease protein
MQSLLLTSLRGRALRVGLLALAVLVVSAAFGLFLSASETTAVQVDEALAQYWRTSYDILIRPPGSRTEIEAQYGLVESHYLSGIAGGITFNQYRAIRDIPGVEVAAPIAMLGYSPQILQLRPNTHLAPGLYRLSCFSAGNRSGGIGIPW